MLHGNRQDNAIMADLLVTSIQTKPNNKTCKGIVSLGGPGAEKAWKWSVDKVIANIDARSNAFFTNIGGQQRKIEVITEPGMDRYLKTRSDDAGDDSLMLLPSA
jgi:hypothetical protein